MIEAAERHQLNELFIAPLRPERRPELVAHLRPVVELVRDNPGRWDLSSLFVLAS